MGEEKEVTVKLVAEVDDSDVSDLESTIKEMDNTTVHIPVETESSSWYQLQSEIEQFENEKILINMGVLDGDVDEVQSKIDDLKQQQIDLPVNTDDSSVDDVKSSVEDLETEIENVNNTPISPQADTSGVDNASESVSGLNEALTAVGAGVSLAGMEQMVATAGNIQDSWNRLGLTFGEVNGQMKNDIAEAGEATGRSGSLIRGYFNDMGIAGVTNTELLQQSFEALSGRAYQTGNSIESMEQKMKMMVMSGNAGARQLTQLGISTADLGRVMGVSADETSKMFKSLSQEERLRVLSQAMGDGKNANEMYKSSWQGLKDQVDKTTGALMGAVGNMILPFLVPAMKVATQAIEALSAGFKALPAPLQGVIGGVLTVVMGFLALTTVIGTVQAVANAINLIQTATQLWSAVTRIATTVQAALNAVMMMNPYILVAVAIIALIAALVYLYTTCEPVRNVIDGLGQALWGLGEAIYGGIAGAIQWLIEGFIWLWETITGLFTSTSSEGINWLTTMMMVLMGPIGWILLLIQYWDTIGPAVGGALSSMYQSAVNWFNQTGAAIHNFASNLVSQLGIAASNAVSSFANGISNLSQALRDELNGMLSDAANFVGEIGQTMWNAAVNAWNQFLAGLQRHSPGIMMREFNAEMTGIIQYAKDTETPLGSAMRDVGNNAVSNFNPNFNLNNDASNVGAGVVNNEFNFVINGDVDSEERMKRFADYIIELMNWDNNTAGRTV